MNGPRLGLPAPAKLNLYLAITGRRADGYHLLETVIDPIDWCDWLTLERLDVQQVERIGGLAEVADEQDLSVRAARLLAAASGVRYGVRIQLEKAIPSGAGLGGGSADAAAVLKGLNRLWGLDWPLEALAELGLELGADVPAMLYARPLYARGIGERIDCIELPTRSYLVLYPGVSCPTAELYAAPNLVRDAEALGPAAWLAAPRYENAFQPVAVARHPEIARAAAWLQAQCGEAVLSGSGSALWARIDDVGRGSVLVHSVPAPWRARLCRSWRP